MSQYQSDEISRLHRKLLYTTIAIEYLHETVDDGRQKLRFVAAYKEYPRTPIEDSLEDVREILEHLERKGQLGIGNYKILKDIVKFNVKIIEEIEKTEIAIRQIGGTVTPHTENGCDISLVAEVENSTTNEDEWKSASIAIKNIQIDLQSHLMKLTAQNSHNFEWFSRNFEIHLNLMKESNTILRLSEADEKDERIKNFVELAKASKEKLISNDDAFHEFSIRWRTLNKLMIENCKLIAFLQGKGAEFEGYIQSSLFVFLSFRSLEMLDSFWNDYKSGSLNREMRNAFFTDGGPENENHALRLNLSEENYHRYRRFLENQLRTGHDESAGGVTQQEEPTSTTNEDIITVSMDISSGEHKATTSHSNVSSARSPPAKRIRKAEGQISKPKGDCNKGKKAKDNSTAGPSSSGTLSHRYALRSRGPIPEIKEEPTRQPKPVQTSVTANKTIFRKNEQTGKLENESCNVTSTGPEDFPTTYRGKLVFQSKEYCSDNNYRYCWMYFYLENINKTMKVVLFDTDIDRYNDLEENGMYELKNLNLERHSQRVVYKDIRETFPFTAKLGLNSSICKLDIPQAEDVPIPDLQFMDIQGTKQIQEYVPVHIKAFVSEVMEVEKQEKGSTPALSVTIADKTGRMTVRIFDLNEGDDHTRKYLNKLILIDHGITKLNLQNGTMEIHVSRFTRVQLKDPKGGIPDFNSTEEEEAEPPFVHFEDLIKKGTAGSNIVVRTKAYVLAIRRKKSKLVVSEHKKCGGKIETLRNRRDNCRRCNRLVRQKNRSLAYDMRSKIGKRKPCVAERWMNVNKKSAEVIMGISAEEFSLCNDEEREKMIRNSKSILFDLKIMKGPSLKKPNEYIYNVIDASHKSEESSDDSDW